MNGKTAKTVDRSATLSRLQEALGAGNVRQNEPMNLHTTLRVGGPADIFVEAGSAVDVAETVKICREEGAPLLILGNGSNLLVRDGGIRGAVLHMGERFSRIGVEDGIIRAEAGALLPLIAAEALRHGLCGMEFASGIPGSAGGAAALNAGAYGSEMKDIVRAVSAVTREGEITRFEKDGITSLIVSLL